MPCECVELGDVLRRAVDGGGEERLADAPGLDLYETWSWPSVDGPPSATKWIPSSSETDGPCKSVVATGNCAFADGGEEALAVEYRLLKEGTLKLGAEDIAPSGNIIRSKAGPEAEESAVELGLEEGVGVG